MGRPPLYPYHLWETTDEYHLIDVRNMLNSPSMATFTGALKGKKKTTRWLHYEKVDDLHILLRFVTGSLPWNSEEGRLAVGLPAKHRKPTHCPIDLWKNGEWHLVDPLEYSKTVGTMQNHLRYYSRTGTDGKVFSIQRVSGNRVIVQYLDKGSEMDFDAACDALGVDAGRPRRGQDKDLPLEYWTSGWPRFIFLGTDYQGSDFVGLTQRLRNEAARLGGRMMFKESDYDPFLIDAHREHMIVKFEPEGSQETKINLQKARAANRHVVRDMETADEAREAFGLF